jgi:hypothetical protein
MALAARLPKLCTAASSPNADPAAPPAPGTRQRRARPSPHSRSHPGGHEPGGQSQDSGRAAGEAGIGQPEQAHAHDQDQDGAAPIPEPTGRDAGQGGGQVVGDIQAEGQLGRPVLAAARGQQLAGPQDQQGGGQVAELKGPHPDHQPAQPPRQHWPDAQPQGLAFPLLGAGAWRMA